MCEIKRPDMKIYAPNLWQRSRFSRVLWVIPWLLVSSKSSLACATAFVCSLHTWELNELMLTWFWVSLSHTLTQFIFVWWTSLIFGHCAIPFIMQYIFFRSTIHLDDMMIYVSFFSSNFFLRFVYFFSHSLSIYAVFSSVRALLDRYTTNNRAMLKWYSMYVSECMTQNRFLRIYLRQWNDCGRILVFKNASHEATNINLMIPLNSEYSEFFFFSDSPFYFR